MSFPWAAKTNTRTIRHRDLARLATPRLRRKSLRLIVVLALSGVSAILNSPPARAEPPRTELPKEVSGTGFVTAGTAAISARTASTLTVTQQSQKAILNWQSFNIGRDASVEFKQPNASSAALNRIFQGSPSEIFGRLSANGQVYLLNQNGIIFGNGAVVDTHSLVASTINISDQVFKDGLTGAINQGQAAFDSGAAGATGFIRVESGAVLKTNDVGERIMIFAPRIENQGEIHTPGGQAILAASQDKVFLANSDDPNLRGLLVEVKTGGSVDNLGKIVAERGNVSLLGLAVNQSGVVRATTSVNLNGSIRLVAQDQASAAVSSDGVGKAQATHTGSLTLGENSLSEVAPDDLTQTAADAQAQPLSQVTLVGDKVTLKSGARIVAPAGNVAIAATVNPAGPGPISNPGSHSQFLMETGSRIDVSGLRSAVLPMERNVVAVELRGNELRDAPLQRNGPLYGETVYVDVRKGTPLADISGQIAALQRPLDERLSAGGKVSIASDDAVVTQAGAVIDVSGGAIRYQDGYLNTTQLVSQGKVYDISNADPNLPYDGIFGLVKVVNKKWGVTENIRLPGSARYESGYVEGKDAGTVAINARDLTQLQGTLRGEVTTGHYQRLPQSGGNTGFTRPYDQTPLGGELVLGAAGQDASWLNDYELGSLSQLGTVGMNRLRIYANGAITIQKDANLAFAPGGELTLSAGSVDVEGSITAQGGNVHIKALGGSSTPDGFSAELGGTGRIDVSGQWINDSVALNSGAAPQGPTFIDGGKVTIEAAGDLALKAGSVIDAGGGAQWSRDGKLKYGTGGTITITDSPSVASAAGASSAMRLDGELRANSFDKGGSLNLTGAGFRIEDGLGDALAQTGVDNTIYLKPKFFELGGFNAYNLTATHTGITVAQGIDVRLRPMNRVLGPRFNLQPTGTNLAQMGSLGFLPDYQQQPVSLGLTLARAAGVPTTARVEMESGSAIHTNPGASVALISDTNLIVDGTIAAPAGNIQLSLSTPNADNVLVESSNPSSKAIWLGPQGRLLAGAIYQPVPDSTGRGLRWGTVRDGGTVNVIAATGNTKQGYFIASPGSRIDVSGTTQTLDVAQGPTMTPTPVNGAAGSIALTAAEGMVLNGELAGAPGNGSGAAGGALSIAINPKNQVGATIAVTTASVNTPAFGGPMPNDQSVGVNPETVRAGGFDRLALIAKSSNSDTAPDHPSEIRLDGNVRLKLARSLVLDTPVLTSDGGQVELAAPYVALGTKELFNLAPPPPQPGNGSLLVHGQHVDLIGTLALRGFGRGAATTTPPVRIESDGDIRLMGGNQLDGNQINAVYTNGFYSAGRLSSAADLELRAAQIYTATATDFTISVTGSGGKIAIQPGGTSEAPLSAGSKLTLAADDIEQNGTLLAPFGQIELDAKNSLVLANGSVTSVSGAGQLVPFGKTEFGQDWLYPFTVGSNVTNGIYTAAPEKRVSLNASQVTLAPGSVVDVTGGGDLLASEQQPGPGGSFDILLDPARVNGAFAIVPTRRDRYGSYDPYYSSVSSVQPGDTIYLAGGGPLAAGEYAMLPAGYALLPEAYLATPLAKTSSPVPGQAVQQFDGSAIVAGQRGAAGADARSNLWSAFLVENGTQVRNRAEYLESRADSFFANGAGSRNRDAGQLVVNAGTALSLGGTLASNATGGRGSEVDILADNLAVVTSFTGAGNRVELLDTGLNELNADSLLLGATREHQGADLALDVRASEVTVESGTALSAPEVMLAAKAHVAVASGATITATDGDRVGAPDSIRLGGDSALARVSSADQVRVQRASGTGTTGTLDIAAGATLDASRSITLDASQDTVVDGDMRTYGGSLSLAASRISLGETQGAAITSGLVLSNDRLSGLEARDLTLNSHGSIDFYGQVLLNNLNKVALNAAGLGGYGDAAQSVSVSADTIALSNRSNVVDTGAPRGNGTLNLAAREMTLGEGNFAVRGFSRTTISATEQIIAKPETDTPVQLHVAGDLTLEASRLTAAKGADVSIDTQGASNVVVGKMTLTAPATTATLAPVTDLGAKLELTATEVDHGTRIELPSGIASLHATAVGGVNIADNASIDVSGRDLAFADTTVGSPGGNVSLIADQGNVTVGAVRIDVSGAPSGGDAGKLSILAPNGVVQVAPNAQLAAHAVGARAGSFALDTQALTNGFSALNAALNVSGFTDSRQLRLRSGDVVIAAADTVLAHNLRIAADAGRIDVLGKIDASGEQAGQVALYAGDDVSLHGSARIDAHATGVDKKGGAVTVATRNGRIDLPATDTAGAASIDVAGTDATGAPADTGTVNLRAARGGTGGVAVNPVSATISGAERVNIEAYKTYTASSIDSGLIATIQAETGTYMAGTSQIKNALGIAADSRFHLLPDVEIWSAGDLALNADWDLLNWRYGGDAGVLTLRAAGNLSLNRNLSDGVMQVVNDVLGTARDTAQTGPSWSYRLTGGADLTAADPLTLHPGVGDVTVGAGVKVRTGTGDIDIAAGEDLRFADTSAAMYTVGENRGTGVMPATDLPADVIKELLFNGDFLGRGGDIRIIAGGDIWGANSHQLINEWLSRVGGSISLPDGSVITLPASWAVNLDKFQQNLGALGGGNVTLTAGGSVNDLSVVIPTTGQPVGAGGTAPAIAGGGDLRIDAGGDIRSGVFYVDKGQADLQAGGSVTRASGESVYPVLALGDGQYMLRARKDVAVESVVNPTVLPMSTQGLTDFIGPTATFFFTYAPDSAARFEAVSGDVVLHSDSTALQSYNLLNNNTGASLPGSLDAAVLNYLPGTASARSLQGDIVLGGTGATLLPAPHGNLELLAEGSIAPAGAAVNVLLSDADPAQLPGTLTPAPNLADAKYRLSQAGTLTHAAAPVHLDDARAVRVVAQTGDIGSPEGSGNQLILNLAKQARLYAGRDIRNLTLKIQNVNASDISVVEAGGDVVFPAERNSGGNVISNTKLFQVAGPGQFYVIAGKNVDLGGSSGVVSIGNLRNPALADGGASITVMAGQTQPPDYDAFIDRYLVTQDIYRERLAQYMRDLGSNETGVDAFRALPRVEQRKFILEILFNELRESGTAAVESKNYERGFAAIKTLFPGDGHDGEVKSFLSQITTTDGGDINLVVPGGLVNAGVAGSTLVSKPADQIGIVAAREGSINAFVQGDFLVNQSRVFALDGGDILIWSSTGNIDAGRGAKTALSIPPPTTTFDANGNTVLQFPPAIAGSGIRAAVSTPGREPGDVTLVAPVGVINAGDAGIGSAGNLTIAATAVIGADNIQVGGTSVGVPADTGGLGAGLIGVTNVASSVAKSPDDAVKDLTDNTGSGLSFLDVQVTGFGGDPGSEVVELRKRKQ